MNRSQCAYLINTTPKYFYLLRLHMLLLQRYAPSLRWPVFLATEEPNHPTITALVKEFPTFTIIPLTQCEEPFLESRLAGAKYLAPHFDYVFPIQEDFLLEGRPMADAIKEAFHIFDTSPSVDSIRLMPCPGPRGGLDAVWDENPRWKILSLETDQYIFCYQATLWRTEAYIKFMTAILDAQDRMFGEGLSPSQKVEIQVRTNLAEIEVGQKILVASTNLHLGWVREGSWPNAVFLSPWPYRPTAVVKGRLQDWAVDLAAREGISLADGPSLR